MKFVLIHWTESNETSILSEEFVKDKSMLNDPEKEGMVMFGDATKKAPKTGWKSYLARVLATSDSKKELMKRELGFLHNGHLETDGDCTVVRSSAKRLQLEEPSAGNKKPAKIMKKNKDVKKQAERKAYEQVFSRVVTPVESDESSEEELNKYDTDESEPGETTTVPACSDKVVFFARYSPLFHRPACPYGSP